MIDCARSACVFRVVAFTGVALALSACGGGSSSSSASSANRAPDLQGTPPATVAAGTAYEFKPTATDPDQDAITFSVANKPAWASFDAQTGRLWGTPGAADAGEYAGIEVAATDGTARDVVTFTITVQPAAKGATSVTLAWAPPTENIDGSALTNLSGYRIHYGNASGSYSAVVKLDNPGLTRYVVENLAPGTYYFSVTAVSSNGSESDFSGEAQATVS